jgi:hypothetical protein
MMSPFFRTPRIAIVSIKHLRASDLENLSQERREANLLGAPNSDGIKMSISPTLKRRLTRRRRCLRKNISGAPRPALISVSIGEQRV